MPKINCIHFNTCVTGSELMCGDPKCPLNKFKNKKEQEQHLETLSNLLKYLREQQKNEE